MSRFLPAGWLACGVALGCAGADSPEVEETRARIEAEFGPRDDGKPPSVSGEPHAAQGDLRSEIRVDQESERATGRMSDPEEVEEAAPVPGVAAPADELREAAGREERSPASTPAEDAAGPGGPGPVSVDSLLALTNAAHASLERLRATFTQRIENPLLGRTREGRGSWYQAGRNRFRMDFDDPANDVYVADGSCLWLYEPSLHDQVMVSHLEQGVEIGTIDILGRLLSEARTRYDGVDGGIEVVGAAATRVVLLTPRERPARYVEVGLWIGISDHYVRRFRIREENRTLRTVTLTRIEPQARIDASVFDYEPPAGVPIFPGDVRCD